MKIFIDTEFTDFTDTQLISIGLAAKSGEVFYAELPFHHMLASDFVLKNVIPLLTPEKSLMSYVDFRVRLLAWLTGLWPEGENLEICFDFDGDFQLLEHALGDQMPVWCKPRHVGRNINELYRLEYHKKHNLPEHHALNDALAIRYAFRER